MKAGSVRETSELRFLVCLESKSDSVFLLLCATFTCSGNRIDATLVSRHKELQREVCDLTEAEERLDELISKCNLQLRRLTEDPLNKKYPFGWDRVAESCRAAERRRIQNRENKGSAITNRDWTNSKWSPIKRILV